MRFRPTIWTVAQLLAFCGAVIFVLVSGAYRSAKHALYYSKVDSVVQTADTACSVIGLTDVARSIVANNPRLANEQWADCDDARVAKVLLGDQVKLSTRQQARVRYVSPADGREHVNVVALTVYQSRVMPTSGATLPIYAHKKDPSVIDPDY